jgi:uncharacterized protein with HEPN domain
MKPELGDKQRILHILEAIKNVEEFVISFQFEEFQESKLHRAATERQLEIIGEATASISEELKQKYPEVEWQPIKRFRNVIAHEYFGVSVQILWGVIQKELPILKIQIEQILNDFQETTL